MPVSEPTSPTPPTPPTFADDNAELDYFSEQEESTGTRLGEVLGTLSTVDREWLKAYLIAIAAKARAIRLGG